MAELELYLFVYVPKTPFTYITWREISYVI